MGFISPDEWLATDPNPDVRTMSEAEYPAATADLSVERKRKRRRKREYVSPMVSALAPTWDCPHPKRLFVTFTFDQRGRFGGLESEDRLFPLVARGVKDVFNRARSRLHGDGWMNQPGPRAVGFAERGSRATPYPHAHMVVIPDEDEGLPQFEVALRASGAACGMDVHIERAPDGGGIVYAGKVRSMREYLNLTVDSALDLITYAPEKARIKPNIARAS